MVSESVYICITMQEVSNNIDCGMLHLYMYVYLSDSYYTVQSIPATNARLHCDVIIFEEDKPVYSVLFCQTFLSAKGVHSLMSTKHVTRNDYM